MSITAAKSATFADDFRTEGLDEANWAYTGSKPVVYPVGAGTNVRGCHIAASSSISNHPAQGSDKRVDFWDSEVVFVVQQWAPTATCDLYVTQGSGASQYLYGFQYVSGTMSIRIIKAGVTTTYSLGANWTMRYLRVAHNALTLKVDFYAGNALDGSDARRVSVSSWTTQNTTGSSSSTLDDATIAMSRNAAAGAFFVIGSVNAPGRTIDRSPGVRGGYLNRDFTTWHSNRAGEFNDSVVGAMSHEWKLLTNTGTAKVAATGNTSKALSLTGGNAGSRASIRSGLVAKIKNVDFTTKVALFKSVDTQGYYGMFWRSNDAGTSRYQLNVYTDECKLVVVNTPSGTAATAAVSSVLAVHSIVSDLGAEYDWRVNHFDDQITVYRDGVELFGVTDLVSHIDSPGHIGMEAYADTSIGDHTIQADISKATAVPAYDVSGGAVGVQLLERTLGVHSTSGDVNETPVVIADDPQQVSDLEEELGTRFNVVHHHTPYSPGVDADVISAAQAMAAQGRQNVISWNGLTELTRIAAGTEDSALAAMATAIQTIPGTVYLDPLPYSNLSMAWSPLLLQSTSGGAGTGTVLSGTTTTLTVSGAPWAENKWINNEVRWVSGGQLKAATVLRNTSNTIHFVTAIPAADVPAAGAVYFIPPQGHNLLSGLDSSFEKTLVSLFGTTDVMDFESPGALTNLLTSDQTSNETVGSLTNLLGTHQSGSETSGNPYWVAATGTTAVASTGAALDGSKSLAISRTSTTGVAMAHTNDGVTDYHIAVTAGATIDVSAWVKAASDKTGRAGSVTVDFQTAGSVAVGTTQTMTTFVDNPTSWTRARGSLVVPATATKCRISLRMADIPTGEIHYFDRIELVVLPAPSWVNVANATVYRGSRMVRSGSYSLAATPVAAGTMNWRPTPTYGTLVTAGTTIRVSGWFRSNTQNTSLGMHLYFQDAGSVQVGGIVTAFTVTPSTTEWTYGSGTVVVPATAVKVGVTLNRTAVATTEIFYADDVQVAVLANPEWVDSGDAEVTRTDAQVRTGGYSLQLKGVGTPAGRIAATTTNYSLSSLFSGDVVELSCYTRAATATRSVSLYALFYNSSSVLVGSDVLVATATNSTSAWTKLIGSVVVPATATKMKVRAYVTSAGGGEIHYFDDFVVESVASSTWTSLASTVPTTSIRRTAESAMDGTYALRVANHSNLISNPSFETNTTGWTTSGVYWNNPSTSITRIAALEAGHGDWHGQVVCPGSTVREGVNFTVSSGLLANTQYTLTIHLRSISGSPLRFGIHDATNGISSQSADLAPVGALTKYTLNITTGPVTPANMFIGVITNDATPVASTFRIDSVTLRPTALAGARLNAAGVSGATAGQVVTLSAWTRAATTPRTITIAAVVSNSGGTPIGSMLTATSVVNTTSGWTKVEGAITLPANAHYVNPYLLISDTDSTGDTHYFDRVAVNANVSNKGQTFAQYRAAYQYIRNFFRAAGSKAKFIFSLNWMSDLGESYTNSMADLYPGDDYVDNLLIRAVNLGVTAKDSGSWRAASQMLSGTPNGNGIYDQMVATADLSKKIFLLAGCAETHHLFNDFESGSPGTLVNAANSGSSSSDIFDSVVSNSSVATPVYDGFLKRSGAHSFRTQNGAQTRPTYVVSATDGHDAFPGLTKLADGRLAAVWRRGTGHTTYDGSILMAYSSDNGVTWTTPVVIQSPAAGYDMRDPSLMVLANGNLALSYFERPPPGPPSATYFTTSTNNGATWSSRVQIAAAINSAPVLERPGRLLMPTYSTATSAIHVYHSTDGGATWPTQVEIASSVSIPNGSVPIEPHLMYLPSTGEIVCLMRTNGAQEVHRSVSTDNGLTWSTPHSLWPWTSDSRIQMAMTDSGVAYAFNRNFATNFNQLVMRSSMDGFDSSTRETVIMALDYRNTYAAAVQTSANTVGLVMSFESSTFSSSTVYFTEPVKEGVLWGPKTYGSWVLPTTPTTQRLSFGGYFMFTGLGTASSGCNIMELRKSGVSRYQLRLDTATGGLSVESSEGTRVSSISTVLTNSTWYRIEFDLEFNPDTLTAQNMVVKVYNPAISDAPGGHLESDSFGPSQLDLVIPDEVRVGVMTSDSQPGFTGVMYADDIKISFDCYTEIYSKAAWIADLLATRGYPQVTTTILFSGVGINDVTGTGIASLDYKRNDVDTRLNGATYTRANIIESFSSDTDSGRIHQRPQIRSVDYVDVATTGALEYMRLEEVGYAPLVLSPRMGGVLLRDFNLGSPSVRAAIEERTTDDGSLDYSQFFGTKGVTLNFLCFTDTAGSVGFYQDALTAWVNPSRRPTLVYKMKGGIEKSVRLRPDTVNRGWTVDGVRTDTNELQLQFVAIDGKDFSTLENSVLLPYNEVVQLVTPGTAGTSPIVRFWGGTTGSTNPMVIHLSEESRSGFDTARVGIGNSSPRNIIIPSGQFVEVDMLARTVQLNGLPGPESSYMRNLSARQWFRLTPYYNDLIFQSTDGNGFATVHWRDSYL